MPERSNDTVGSDIHKEHLEKTKFDIERFVAKWKKDLNKVRVLSTDQILGILYQDLLSYKEFKEYSDSFVSYVKGNKQKERHQVMFYFLMDHGYFINQTYNEGGYDHLLIPCIKKERPLAINDAVIDGLKNDITHYYEINNSHFKSVGRTQYDCIIYNKAIDLKEYYNFNEGSILVNELIHRYLNMRSGNYNDLSSDEQGTHELMSDLGMMMEYPKTMVYYIMERARSKDSGIPTDLPKQEYQKTYQFMNKICDQVTIIIKGERYGMQIIADSLRKSKDYDNANELYNDVLPYFEKQLKTYIKMEFSSKLMGLIIKK